MPLLSLRIVNAVWCIAMVAYMVYGWYAYSGLYRVFAEWQLSVFGSYEVLLTGLLPLLALLLPSLGLALALPGRKEAAATSPFPVGRRNVLVLSATGIVALLVAAGAGVLGHLESERTKTPPATFDLRRDRTPPAADRFVVIGMARTDLVISLETQTGDRRRKDVYVPLTAPGWSRNEPLAYFLKTSQGSLTSAQAPFLMTTAPTVMEVHGLPGPVREAYRRTNVALATRLHVFNQSTAERLHFYWAVAGVGALSGVSGVRRRPVLAPDVILMA